jgi:hypothetical protein
MVDPDSGEAVLKAALFAKMRTNICDLAKAAGTHVTTLELWAVRDSVRLAPAILQALAPQLMGMMVRYDPAEDKLYKLVPEAKPMVVPERFDPRSSPYATENLRAAASPAPPQPPQPPARRPGWK